MGISLNSTGPKQIQLLRKVAKSETNFEIFMFQKLCAHLKKLLSVSELGVYGSFNTTNLVVPTHKWLQK
jgi:hypothetical protein